MKFVVFLLCVVAWAFAGCDDGQFQLFKKKFDRYYSTALEDEYRSKVFANNLKLIAEHNQLYQKGQSTFLMGITQFADLTTSEYSTKMLDKFTCEPTGVKGVDTSFFRASAPDSIDWRNNGYVGPVTDQGQCGAAWTFAVTGAMEGLHLKATGIFVKLSEQNLADCTYGVSIGCAGGGRIDDGFQYVIDNGGIAIHAGNPATSDGACHYDDVAKGASATNYVQIPSKNESALKESCGTIGPIATYVDASHATFQLYSSGIYYEPECSQDIVDQAVLIVGYGSEAGTDYWIVKNSWGRNWGENGYIRMIRNKENNCGIASQSSYPSG